MSYLDSTIDFTDPRTVAVYDELPLWSAMFGLLLLDHVPLAGVRAALDVGCGTGFPLIELAERLGPDAHVDGIDPWREALGRAAEKIRVRGTPNVTLHEGSAAQMPFDDASFDLIVSNLGLNNFADRDAAIRECRRVARPGATLAITTNLRGHMQEFYDVLAEVVNDKEALRKHIEHRATIPGVHELLAANGFAVTRVVESSGRMRFASGTALLNHYFIRLGFLPDWIAVAGKDAFAEIERRLDHEIALTIPMAYVEATTRS